MKNTSYCVTGLSNAKFDNSSTNNAAAISQGGPITPYNQETTNVKIGTEDIGANPYNVNSKLVNLIVYGTDEPDTTYTGSTTFRFTLTEDSFPEKYDRHPERFSVASSWSLTGRITSSVEDPFGKFIFKVRDGRNWQSVSMNAKDKDFTLLSVYHYSQHEQNVQRAFMDFLVLEVYNLSGELLKTWDIQKRFTVNTSNFDNATTISNPVVTDINPETAYPSITFFNNTSTTYNAAVAGIIAQAVFTFTVNA